MSRSLRYAFPLLALIVAGCSGPPRPAPTPPAPRPAPTPPPAPTDWRDLPETKGAWRYLADANGSVARFETAETPLVILRCDKAARRVGLSRTDAPGVALRITTSYGSRTIAPSDLAASDPLLDQIAFSRGRFTIEAAGKPELVLPAWAEPARVIEDCRG